eukprot:1382928-Prymnesium_polylepis.1
MWWPFKPPPPPPPPEPSMLPAVLAVVLCWVVPALCVVWQRDRSVARFAALELVTTGVGNALMLVTALYTAYYQWSDDGSVLAGEVVLWLLFVLLYFPVDGHISPAITAGAWACGQCTLGAAALNVAMQMIGSALAIESVKALVDPQLRQHYHAPTPFYLEMGVWPAVQFELKCTFAIVLLCL